MERIQYLINKIVTFIDRNGNTVTTNYTDAIYYSSPQSQSVYDADTNTRVNAWIAAQQAPLPPDPVPIYSIACDDGTTINI